ncbi:hypothetical protein CEN49_22830, partial [Fischerella thermalis CCMEE 5273]
PPPEDGAPPPTLITLCGGVNPVPRAALPLALLPGAANAPPLFLVPPLAVLTLPEALNWSGLLPPPNP